LFGEKAPLPVLVHIPVLFKLCTVPVRDIIPAVEHITWLGPAFTVASGTMKTEVVLVTTGQGPLPVELNVKVTKPLLISAPERR
jgi:hypothetical protein